MDFDAKSLTAEEKKMIEAKRRERTKGKTRPSRKMDIIDQLDATSIYGTGCMYNALGDPLSNNLLGCVF
jgi:hypothetical protein